VKYAPNLNQNLRSIARTPCVV